MTDLRAKLRQRIDQLEDLLETLPAETERLEQAVRELRSLAEAERADVDEMLAILNDPTAFTISPIEDVLLDWRDSVLRRRAQLIFDHDPDPPGVFMSVKDVARSKWGDAVAERLYPTKTP